MAAVVEGKGDELMIGSGFEALAAIAAVLYHHDLGASGASDDIVPEASGRDGLPWLAYRDGEDCLTFSGSVHCFNGIVASDKFCMSRMLTLDLTWRRGPSPAHPVR